MTAQNRYLFCTLFLVLKIWGNFHYFGGKFVLFVGKFLFSGDDFPFFGTILIFAIIFE
jgi:hypothetical protein